MEQADAAVKDNASPEPLLEARGLCKYYGSREVLHEVNLAIRPKEIVTLVGPNGAGKTTLLTCLLGLQKPDHGEVLQAPHVRIGYVPQHFRAQSSMPLSVDAFLKLYAPRVGERMVQLAERLEISSLLPHALDTLSGGELRRVLLLRALLRQPHLLVLDEPTQGVDIAGQGDFYRLLKKLSDEQDMAVLMVSHDLYVVMASTERVICLNRHICCEGSPSQVGSDPKFTELFGADLAKNLAMYHHHHTHTHGVAEEHFHHDHNHEGCSHG